MTYDEFKTYLLVHLWKMGDSVIIENLDTIVKTAEAEINRDLKVEDRVIVADIVAEDTTWPVPDDFQVLRHASSPQCGEMKYLIPSDFANRKATRRISTREFTVANRNLRLIGNITVETPVTIELWYYRKVPFFPTLGEDETSWVVEDFFDVYLYTVLKHTAPFLREDDRLNTWGALQAAAMQSAMDDSLERKYAGSPLKIQFPAGVR